MAIVRITINDYGKHWHKRVWLFGIPIYHRHDFTEEEKKKTAGFNTLPFNPVDVEEEYLDE